MRVTNGKKETIKEIKEVKRGTQNKLSEVQHRRKVTKATNEGNGKSKERKKHAISY